MDLPVFLPTPGGFYTSSDGFNDAYKDDKKMENNKTELNLNEMQQISGGFWPVLAVLFGGTVLIVGNEIYNKITGNDE